jgi:hypothetical protein
MLKIVPKSIIGNHLPILTTLDMRVLVIGLSFDDCVQSEVVRAFEG